MVSNSEKLQVARSVFVLWHVHTVNGEDDSKLIGVYESRERAEAAIKRLVQRPGFSVTPQGFYVDEYELDADNWSEGYVTV